MSIKVYPTPSGSVTFDNDEDGTDKLQTILKVVEQLCNDGVFASVGLSNWGFWVKPLTVLDKENKILYAYIKDDEDGVLSNHDKAQMVADELETYCFDVFVKDNAVGFRYKHDTSSEKSLYDEKLKKSLGKILKH